MWTVAPVSCIRAFLFSNKIFKILSSIIIPCYINIKAVVFIYRDSLLIKTMAFLCPFATYFYTKKYCEEGENYK